MKTDKWEYLGKSAVVNKVDEEDYMDAMQFAGNYGSYEDIEAYESTIGSNYIIG